MKNIVSIAACAATLIAALAVLTPRRVARQGPAQAPVVALRTTAPAEPRADKTSSSYLVSAARVEESSTESHERQSSPLDTSEVECDLPTRPIAYNHPTLVRNIVARQTALRDYLSYVRLERPDPQSYVGFITIASQLAILVQLDAEGRSDIAAESTNPRPSIAATELEHACTSGGAYYRFNRGEFPEFDRITELEVEFPNGIPVGELPLKAIEGRILRAISYSTE